jgi:putative transposase
MARLSRLYAPQVPQLVQAQFAHALATPADATPAAELDQLLGWLQEGVREHRVAVHGWVLLSDRLTLLATPPGADSLPRLMQSFGRKFATRLQHGRVFSGRYRSALVEPGHWVLPALIWLESLPVQWRYVDRAEEWPWSSAAGHTGSNVGQSTWVIDHQDYWENGNTPFARQAGYRQRLDEGLPAQQGLRIQKALFGQWALGEADFLSRLEALATRRLAPAPRGRPRKVAGK